MIEPSVRQLRPAPDLLACVVYTGSSLYLAEAIRRGETLDFERLSYLLLVALAPYFVREIDLELIEPEINFETLTMLVELGADPAHTSNGLCPWKLVITRVTRSLEQGSLPKRAPASAYSTQAYSSQVHDTCTALRILLVFARNAPNLQKCHDMYVVEDGLAVYPSSRSESRLPRKGRVVKTASRAVRELLLQQRCCSSCTIQSCQCHKAQTIRPLALELLGLMAACEQDRQRADGVECGRPKARRSCIPDIKQIFASRRQNRGGDVD